MMRRRTQEVPLQGDVSQNEEHFYVRYGTLVAEGFPVPPVKGDRLVDAAGRTATVDRVEALHGLGAVEGYKLVATGL